MAFEEDHGHYFGRFDATQDAEKPTSFFLDDELEALLWQLWRTSRDVGFHWRSARFTLRPDGRFEIDYDRTRSDGK